jgi:hypothetical protein
LNADYDEYGDGKAYADKRAGHIISPDCFCNQSVYTVRAKVYYQHPERRPIGLTAQQLLSFIVFGCECVFTLSNYKADKNDDNENTQK